MHFAALPHALADIRTGQHTIEITFRTQGPRLAEIFTQQPDDPDIERLLRTADGDLIVVLVSAATVP
jgi:hypothetical protein